MNSVTTFGEAQKQLGTLCWMNWDDLVKIDDIYGKTIKVELN